MLCAVHIFNSTVFMTKYSLQIKRKRKRWF